MLMLGVSNSLVDMSEFPSSLVLLSYRQRIILFAATAYEYVAASASVYNAVDLIM